MLHAYANHTALTAILLALCLIPLAWSLRKDSASYRAFKALTGTQDRQRRFLIWTIKSFLLFSGSTFICLALMGRLSAINSIPPEFLRLSSFFHSLGPSPSSTIGFLAGAGCALVAGLFVGIFLRRKKKKQASKPVTLGDIAPMLPRNWAEIGCTTLMSINAGFSEELYFRLLLPLLLAILIGHAIPAFVLAALIFGVAHLYQGAVGVLATTIIGLFMTLIYLITGSIWAAMAAHAFVDLLALTIRPSLIRIFARKQAA